MDSRIREKLSQRIEARTGFKPSEVVFWMAEDTPDTGNFPFAVRIAATFEKHDNIDLVVIGGATILEGDLINDSYTDFKKSEFKQICDILGPHL